MEDGGGCMDVVYRVVLNDNWGIFCMEGGVRDGDVEGIDGVSEYLVSAASQ